MAQAAGGSKRISQTEFTEKAWQAIVAGPEIAQTARYCLCLWACTRGCSYRATQTRSACSQQIVETEHLMKALLEQPNGLARRILSKAGSNPSVLLERTEDYIRSQPRVSGSSDQVCHLPGCRICAGAAAQPGGPCVERVGAA